MKNLLKFKNQSISHEEMRSVKGGASFTCMCTGSSGMWTGNYASQDAADASLSEWCASGTGTCAKQ